jgi:hypothetical protein
MTINEKGCENDRWLPIDEVGILDAIEAALEGDKHWTLSVLRWGRGGLQFVALIFFWVPVFIGVLHAPDWPLLGSLNPTKSPQLYSGLIVLLSVYTFYTGLRIVFLRQRDRTARALVERVNRQLISLSRDLALGKRPFAEAVYDALVRAYRNRDNENAVKVLAQACGVPIREVETVEIGIHFRAGAETATEYLCVINASPSNRLLADIQTIFDYFSRFDRRKYPRDRITRVFSLQTGGMPWEESKPVEMSAEWTQEKRELLFSALWINKCCGVDTKLHLYSESTRNDFFEGADYVLCYDPAAEANREKRIVFHAIRDNEKQCLKIDGLPWLYDLFHVEFYKRLTGGHGVARDSDMIIDFTRAKWQAIRTKLDLPSELSNSNYEALTTELRKHGDWEDRLKSWHFGQAEPQVPQESASDPVPA